VETAVNRISPSRLDRFAWLLKIHVDYLFGGLPGRVAGDTSAQASNNTSLGDHALQSSGTVQFITAYYQIMHAEAK